MNTTLSRLSLELLLERFPDKKKELISQALIEKKRQLAMYRELIGLLSFHPLSLLKQVVAVGVMSFVLAFLVAQFAQLADWYKKLKQLNVGVDVPIVGTKSLDIGSRLPTSTTFEIGTVLPSWGIRECIWFAIGMVALVVITQLVQLFIRWKDVRLMQAGIHEIEQDIHYLSTL